MARGSIQRDSLDFSELIVPYGFGLPSSPPRNRDNLQAPASWEHGGQLGQLNYSMPARTSPPHNLNSRPLSDIEEIDGTPKHSYAHYVADTLASSPTLREPPAGKPSANTNGDRRWSNGSGSVHSVDIENMHWPDFEGPSEADEESVISPEEEEQLGALPEIADSEDPATDEQWLNGPTDNFEDDPLSRRADIILANAKKRLHVMEGNLRGARNSLLLSAPSSPISAYFSQPGDSTRERPRYSTAAGIYGHRPRQYNASPLSSASYDHTRKLSDSPSANGLLPSRGLAVPKRASSALGSFARGLSSLERSASLRGVRSQEVMRESRLQSWIEENPMPDEVARQAEQEHDMSHSRKSSMESLRRPDSEAGSLRSQMDELKGRINNLKVRANEDRLKRLSTSKDRTPSPYSLAEKSPHNNRGSSKARAVNGNTGAGWSPSHSPASLHGGAEFSSHSQKSSSLSDEDSRSSNSKRTVAHTPIYAESHYEDAEEEQELLEEEQEDSDSPSTPSTTVLGGEQKVLMGPHEPTSDELGISRGIAHDLQEEPYEDEDEDEQDLESSLDGKSEYFEAVPVLGERHEDRADAFDYENFFLHSAMGTYSRERRESFSSESSVETTRPSSPRPSPPVEMVLEASSPPGKVRIGYGTLVEASPGLHRRSQSVESISTIASFETATEGEHSDDGADPLDIVTQHILSPPTTSPVNMAPKHLIDSALYVPFEDVHGDSLDNKLVAALASALFQSTNSSQSPPAQDLALVKGVMASLQNVVASMQNQTEDYDRRQWRRRLDAARKALETET